MDCAHSSQIGAYKDGELPSEQRATFAKHLSTCPACATELARLERLSTWMQTAKTARANTGLNWQARLHQRRLERLAGVLTAAAAAVVLACGLWLTGNKSESNTASSTANPTQRSWQRAAATGQIDTQPTIESEDPLLQIVFQDQ